MCSKRFIEYGVMRKRKYLSGAKAAVPAGLEALL
jgi:hypothetical protein